VNALSFRQGWPLYVGMMVAGAAAVVASASTLASLAQSAGWSSWTPWLLPAALDIGGSAGGWCWLRPGVPEPARKFGRVVALAGAGGSLIGNAAGHLMATNYLQPGPVLVVIVGAVPAAVLVALAHLAALLAVPPPPSSAPETDETEDETEEEQTETADTRDAVLQLLHQQPLTIAELAKATGRSRTTVIGHLTALTEAGAVHRDEAKRYRAVARPHLVNDRPPPEEAVR
jgi:DNA-binding transcriptional ArsR family regulator